MLLPLLAGIEQEGSNLSGVSGFVLWEELIESPETVEKSLAANQDSAAATLSGELV